MKPELDSCIIKTPGEKEVEQLCRMLGEVFGVEEKLFGSVARGEREIYHWTPYSLFCGDEIIGNVSLVDMKIFWKNKPLDIYGLASVATPEKYRGMGIAKKLLAFCLEKIDRENIPSCLFTSLPHVYEKSGYVAVQQWTKRFDFKANPFEKKGLDTWLTDIMDKDAMTVMDRIYTKKYPDYDGKHIREEGYWESFGYMFNLTPCAQVIFAGTGKNACGYLRFEEEADRFLITEICVAPDDLNLAEALFAQACTVARDKQISKIILALPDAHFAFKLLRNKGLTLFSEDNPAREVFMVRIPQGFVTKGLESLHWSLADKF